MINPNFSVGFGDTATKNAYLHVKMHFPKHCEHLQN